MILNGSLEPIKIMSKQILQRNYILISVKTIVDWNILDSDHAGVRLWLDIRKKTKRTWANYIEQKSTGRSKQTKRKVAAGPYLKFTYVKI